MAKKREKQILSVTDALNSVINEQSMAITFLVEEDNMNKLIVSDLEDKIMELSKELDSLSFSQLQFISKQKELHQFLIDTFPSIFPYKNSDDGLSNVKSDNSNTHYIDENGKLLQAKQSDIFSLSKYIILELLAQNNNLKNDINENNY